MIAMRYAMLVPIIIIALGCSDSTPSRDPSKEIAQRVASGPFIDLTPFQLFSAYERNSVGADERYKGKALRLTGQVTRIGQDRDGVPLVILREISNDDSDASRTVTCAWTADRGKVARFSPGMRVALRGIGAGQDVGSPLIAFCDGEDAPDARTSDPIVLPKKDLGEWKHMVEIFMEGQEVGKYTATWPSKNSVVIDTEKCDRAKNAIEKAGSLPEGLTVACTTKGVEQWKLTEVKD
jgi:hypothetical protein